MKLIGGEHLVSASRRQRLSEYPGLQDAVVRRPETVLFSTLIDVECISSPAKRSKKRNRFCKHKCRLPSVLSKWCVTKKKKASTNKRGRGGRKQEGQPLLFRLHSHNGFRTTDEEHLWTRQQQVDGVGNSQAWRFGTRTGHDTIKVKVTILARVVTRRADLLALQSGSLERGGFGSGSRSQSQQLGSEERSTAFGSGSRDAAMQQLPGSGSRVLGAGSGSRDRGISAPPAGSGSRLVGLGSASREGGPGSGSRVQLGTGSEERGVIVSGSRVGFASDHDVRGRAQVAGSASVSRGLSSGSGSRVGSSGGLGSSDSRSSDPEIQHHVIAVYEGQCSIATPAITQTVVALREVSQIDMSTYSETYLATVRKAQDEVVVVNLSQQDLERSPILKAFGVEEDEKRLLDKAGYASWLTLEDELGSAGGVGEINPQDGDVGVESAKLTSMKEDSSLSRAVAGPKSTSDTKQGRHQTRRASSDAILLAPREQEQLLLDPANRVVDKSLLVKSESSSTAPLAVSAPTTPASKESFPSTGAGPGGSTPGGSKAGVSFSVYQHASFTALSTGTGSMPLEDLGQAREQRRAERDFGRAAIAEDVAPRASSSAHHHRMVEYEIPFARSSHQVPHSLFLPPPHSPIIVTLKHDLRYVSPLLPLSLVDVSWCLCRPQ